MEKSGNGFAAAFKNCELEPIHTPESIQPGGALVVVSKDAAQIVRASTNLEQFFGTSPKAALGSSLAELVGEGNAQRIMHLPLRGDLQPSTPTVFRLETSGRVRTLVMQVHRVAGDLVIEVEHCRETEQQDDAQLFAATRDALWESAVENDFGRYCQAIVDQVRRVTGFDRLLIYRFDPKWNGEVIAESRNERLPSMAGHHFPAADIPPQARSLYTRNLIRVMVDVDARPVPLLALADTAPVKPLDMSHSVLRAMSPVHLQYLRNMGVGASLSISLMQTGRLWGLISGHHAEPLRVPFTVRELAEFIGKSMSLKLSDLESRERSNYMAQAQDTLVTLTRRIGRSGATNEVLASLSADILRLVGASGAVIAVGGRRYRLGMVPSSDEVDRLMAWLKGHAGGEVFHTDCLPREYPTAKEYEDSAAGLLAVRSATESDFTLWFRPERVRSVPWAGNPERSLITDVRGTRIEPRRSFAVWLQEQRDHSLAWQPIEIECAQALSMTLIEVLAQKALISTTQRTEARLKYLANHDVLTGLPNRLLLQEELSTAVADAEAHDHGLAVVFIDLDRFKEINDTLGHLAGDRYLEEIARRLRSSLRHDDIVARWGGDEFVAVVSRLSTREPLETTIDRVQSCLADPMRVDDHDLIPSASIGVAYYPNDGRDPLSLLRAADAAMYRVKEKNRSLPAGAPGVSTEGSQSAREWAVQLHRALSERQLVVQYEPQFLTADGTLVGLQALLRWQHPTHGAISPSVCPRTPATRGLWRTIDDWAVQTVCAQMAGWAPVCPEHVVVSLSRPLVAIDENLSVRALKAIRGAGLSAHRLGFEITEGQRRHDRVVALRRIADAGVQLSLSDFGVGYLSLTRLRDLPISCYRIARRFTDGAPTDAGDAIVVRSVVALGRSLGARTAAEGVESEAQLGFLRSAGVDIVQGPYLSEPVPGDLVPVYLRRLLT